MTSTGAQIEADELSYWFHLLSPLDCQGIYDTFIEGLAEAKAAYREAAAMHDHGRAARLLLEIVDSTALCAAAADGLALQRARWLLAGKSWPLARLGTVA